MFSYIVSTNHKSRLRIPKHRPEVRSAGTSAPPGSDDSRGGGVEMKVNTAADVVVDAGTRATTSSSGSVVNHSFCPPAEALGRAVQAQPWL